MSSPYALFQLLWRPAALGMAFPLFWAVVWPVVSLTEGTGIPVTALWHDPASAPVRKALWHLVVLVPAALGLFTWLPTHEVRASGLGWSLPGLRRGLQRGTLLICTLVATALGWALSRGSTGVEGAAAFAIACFWFLVPGTLMAPGSRRFLSGALVMSLVAAIAQPVGFGALVTAQPAMLGLLALVAAVAMVRLQFAAVGARRQSLAVDSGVMVWNSRSASWFMGGRGEWNGRLSTDKLLPWIHAGWFESGYGSVSRYFRGLGMITLLFGAGVYWVGDIGMAGLFLGMVVGNRQGQLTSGLAYPLSRTQRARHFYCAAVTHALLATASLAAALALLAALPIPGQWLLEGLLQGDLHLGRAALVFVPWLPIVLWEDAIGDGTPWDKRGLGRGTRYVSIMSYVLLIVVSDRLSERWWDSGHGSVVLVTAAALAVIAWTTLWFVAKRIYARQDLSVDSP